MRVECNPIIFSVAAVHVVDQQPDPNVPVRRLKQLVDQEVPHRVVVKHVVLDIDAAFGELRQAGPGDKRVAPMLEQQNTGLPTMRCDVGCESTPQRGLAPIGGPGRVAKVPRALRGQLCRP